MESRKTFVVTNEEGPVESIAWIADDAWDDRKHVTGSSAIIVYQRSWYTVAIDKTRKFLKI